MKRIALISAVALALVIPASAESRTFVRTVDNPWFPLKPGSVWRYRGVTTTAVSDRLYLSGRLEERTTDWYAQDSRGNVWYFGEDTAELDRNGHVKTREGSWQAGVNAARQGLFMPAHPRVGQTGLQEFLKGHAEDHFKVLRRTRTTLLTKEWTPLEPGVIDHKFYRRGVGTVLEKTVKGGDERNVLVSFKAGS